MKEFKVSYMTQRKSPLSNRYFYEIVKANGIVHANTLAKKHAKKLGATVGSIYERGSTESFR